MPALSPPRSLVAITVASLLGATVTGCGHKVGDACTTNVDCSSLGDRFCDVAVLNGYCTIEGCDVRMNENGELVDSCQNVASESICIRFFTQQSARTCRADMSPSGCNADERCLCDHADPAHVGQCLPTAGGAALAHCAKESSERRWCMLKCDQDSDCRNDDGVQHSCVSAGTNGAEPVPRGLQPVEGNPSLLVGVGDYSQKFCKYNPAGK